MAFSIRMVVVVVEVGAMGVEMVVGVAATGVITVVAGVVTTVVAGVVMGVTMGENSAVAHRPCVTSSSSAPGVVGGVYVEAFAHAGELASVANLTTIGGMEMVGIITGRSGGRLNNNALAGM